MSSSIHYIAHNFYNSWAKDNVKFDGLWFYVFHEFDKIWISNNNRYLNDKISAFIKKTTTCDNTKIRQIRSILQELCRDKSFADKLDKQPYSFPLSNGLVVDLTTGMTRLRTVNDYWSFYSDGYLCDDTSVAEKYIESICLESEELKMWMGYSMTMDRDNTFYIIHGDGCSGKSTFLTIMNLILNHAFQSAPIYKPVEYFTNRHAQDTFNTTRLFALTDDDNRRLSQLSQQEIDELVKNRKCVLITHKKEYLTYKNVKIFNFHKSFKSQNEVEYVNSLKTTYLDQFVTLAVKYAQKYFDRRYEPGGEIFNECQNNIRELIKN